MDGRQADKLGHFYEKIVGGLEMHMMERASSEDDSRSSEEDEEISQFSTVKEKTNAQQKPEGNFKKCSMQDIKGKAFKFSKASNARPAISSREKQKSGKMENKLKKSSAEKNWDLNRSSYEACGSSAVCMQSNVGKYHGKHDKSKGTRENAFTNLPHISKHGKAGNHGSANEEISKTKKRIHKRDSVSNNKTTSETSSATENKLPSIADKSPWPKIEKLQRKAIEASAGDKLSWLRFHDADGTSLNLLGYPATPAQDMAARKEECEDDSLYLPQKYLAKTGYKDRSYHKMQNCQQPDKIKIEDHMKRMVEKQQGLDLEVHVGKEKFYCHMAVLQTHTKFFEKHPGISVAKFPQHKVAPRAFAALYRWMVGIDQDIETCRILEVLQAAEFLGVEKFKIQCWIMLDDVEYFREDMAFYLSYQARQLKLSNIPNLIMTRINKFFLAFIASPNYLLMEVEDVCKLLSSNCIAVHSEIEILWSAVRWLSFDWPQRKAFVLRVMKNVRFSLMAPWLLVELKQRCGASTLHIMENEDVQNLIHDAVDFSILYNDYRNSPTMLQGFLRETPMCIPAQRLWLIEKPEDKLSCKNEHICLNSGFIEYKNFQKYIKKLLKAGKNGWPTLKYLDSEDGMTCSRCIRNIQKR